MTQPPQCPEFYYPNIWWQSISWSSSLWNVHILYTIKGVWHWINEYSYHCNQTNCFQQDCRCQHCKCHNVVMSPKVCKRIVLSWCHTHQGHPSHQECNSHILKQRTVSLTISPLNRSMWHLGSSHWWWSSSHLIFQKGLSAEALDALQP
jgi:hypothetical protein